MHPYFADPDKKPPPAFGDEHFGLLIGIIPPTFAEPFNASINIDESDPERSRGNLKYGGSSCFLPIHHKMHSVLTHCHSVGLVS